MLADPAHQSGATIQIPDLLTVSEAALLVRRHPETLRRAIREGRLAAWRQRGCTLVSPETLKAYLDDYLCPASATKSLISNAVEASTTSSGGQAVNVEDFRRERMMRKMLDKP